MAVLLNPDCRDDNHVKCPNVGLDDDTGEPVDCPCHCHPRTALCGQRHESGKLDHLGPCVMGPDHEGPHHFDGPIEGTVISVTIGDGWDRARTKDAGVDSILEDIGRALAHRPHDEPPC